MDRLQLPHQGVVFQIFDSSVVQGIPEAIGVWRVTYRGQTSGHQAVAYFRITP